MYEGRQVLRRRYVRQGRIDVGIRTRSEPAGDRVDVVYEIEPGPVTAVTFSGVGKRDERRLRRRLEQLWVDGLFRENEIRDSVKLLQGYYQGRGFYAVLAQTGTR